MIRHRACTLRDTAYALIKAEMDTDFEEQCQEISRTRKARKEKVAPLTPGPLGVLHDNNVGAQESKVNKTIGSVTVVIYSHRFR